MKKLNILLIALVAIVYLVGVLILSPKKHNVDDVVGVIRKFEFEGHTYLIRNDSYRGGLCHDENCKCKTDSIK